MTLKTNWSVHCSCTAAQHYWRLNTTTATPAWIRPVALIQLQHYHHANHAYFLPQPKTNKISGIIPSSHDLDLSIATWCSGATQSTPNLGSDVRPPATRTHLSPERDGEGGGDAPDIRAQKPSHQYKLLTSITYMKRGLKAEMMCNKTI